MKKQVLFIHGGSAYSLYEDFLQNLRNVPLRDLPSVAKKKKWSETLSADFGDDFEVFTPSMPNSNNAKYEEWKIWLERHFPYFRDDIVLIGWSLGGMFLFKYLTEAAFPVRIKAFYSLASPSGWPALEKSDLDTGQEDGGDFCFAKEEIGHVYEKVQNIKLWHSKDDFVVPFSEFLELKESLPQAAEKIFLDKTHFLVSELPDLIEAVKKEFI